MKCFKKKIASAIVILFFSCGGMFANYPVIDISNLMQAVSTLYGVYDEVNATIEQVSNTYKQIYNQCAAIKAYDWGNLEENLAEQFNNEDNWDGDYSNLENGLNSTWKNIGNFRTNLTNATNIINENMNMFNDVKHTLENKTVTCMGKQYSVAGMFGIGKYGHNDLFGFFTDTMDYVRETGKDIAKGYAEKLTYKEKEEIMSKWGLDPENYAYVKLVEEQVKDAWSALMTKGSDEYYLEVIKKVAKNNQSLLDLSSSAGESMVGQLQATQGMILGVQECIQNLGQGVREFGSMFAKLETRNDVKEKAEKIAESQRKERLKEEFQKATGTVPDWL